MQTLSGLVRINSINPTLVPGGAGEAKIAHYVAGSLGGFGMQVKTVAPEPGRPSIIGVLDSGCPGRSLMLNAHYATVGGGGMAEAVCAAIRHGEPSARRR